MNLSDLMVDIFFEYVLLIFNGFDHFFHFLRCIHFDISRFPTDPMNHEENPVASAASASEKSWNPVDHVHSESTKVL